MKRKAYYDKCIPGLYDKFRLILDSMTMDDVIHLESYPEDGELRFAECIFAKPSRWLVMNSDKNTKTITKAFYHTACAILEDWTID